MHLILRISQNISYHKCWLMSKWLFLKLGDWNQLTLSIRWLKRIFKMFNFRQLFWESWMLICLCNVFQNCSTFLMARGSYNLSATQFCEKQISLNQVSDVFVCVDFLIFNERWACRVSLFHPAACLFLQKFWRSQTHWVPNVLSNLTVISQRGSKVL